MQSILIVDDDISLCNILSEELNEEGYDTSYLTNGTNVEKFLNDNKTDLVLLDLNVPGKGGFDIQKDINDQSRFKTKVIILTAFSDERSVIMSARLGASDFLCKPCDFEELKNSIKKVLR